MKELSFDEMRKIQLDILGTVHEFCVERNLRYSLAGGTLLGAVRHKGYIPWDDDIDIMMPRQDYERFVKEFIDYKPQYICGCWENDRKYVYPFAKVYDNRTLLIEKTYKHHLGINIDVFPIDGAPEDVAILNSHLRRINFIRTMLSFKHLYISYHSGFIRKVIGVIAQLLPNVAMQKKCKRHTTKYDFENSKFAGAIMGTYGIKEIYDQKIFLDYQLVPFEQHSYYAIKHTDIYLKQHYGDYMQLPPIEKQVPPHDVVAYLLSSEES